MVTDVKTQHKTYYEYTMQMKDASGKWFDLNGLWKDDTFFPIWKEYLHNDVRLMRRKITVGKWKVQK
jgi:hypothetical protein